MWRTILLLQSGDVTPIDAWGGGPARRLGASAWPTAIQIDSRVRGSELIVPSGEFNQSGAASGQQEKMPIASAAAEARATSRQRRLDGALGPWRRSFVWCELFDEAGDLKTGQPTHGSPLGTRGKRHSVWAPQAGAGDLGTGISALMRVPCSGGLSR